jgi:hypothetical protein
MGRAGRERAEEFSWPRVTGRVESYYNFVIRRLAATGGLPEGFGAPIPPRAAAPQADLPAPTAAVLRDGTEGGDGMDGTDAGLDTPAASRGRVIRP